MAPEDAGHAAAAGGAKVGLNGADNSCSIGAEAIGAHLDDQDFRAGQRFRPVNVKPDTIDIDTGAAPKGKHASCALRWLLLRAHIRRARIDRNARRLAESEPDNLRGDVPIS